MNCLEFRRMCLSEPASAATTYLAHRKACEDCRRFAEGIDVLDGKLRSAMQVPVPEDLTSRIKLRQILGDEHRTRGARPWQWALAASVLVTLALGGFFAYQIRAAHQQVAAMQTAAIEHVETHHEHVLLVAQSAALSPEAQFRHVLAAFGGRVSGSVGPVKRAFVCGMNNRPIAHAELSGVRGDVTVLYVTGERIADDTEFSGDAYKGILVPAGAGVLVILGSPAEPLTDLANTLKQSIHWEI